RGQCWSPDRQSPPHRPPFRDVPSARRASASSAEDLMQRGNIERGEAIMLEPSQIGFEKRAQIRDAVFQHRETVDAEAEGVTLIARRIDAAHLQHARMHHAGACDLEPILALAEFDL